MISERINLGEEMISDCLGDVYIDFEPIYAVLERKGVKIDRVGLGEKI